MFAQPALKYVPPSVNFPRFPETKRSLYDIPADHCMRARTNLAARACPIGVPEVLGSSARFVREAIRVRLCAHDRYGKDPTEITARKTHLP